MTEVCKNNGLSKTTMTAKIQTKKNSKTEAAKLPIVSGVKASLKNYRQAPRKVRLVADMIRGKRAQEALSALAHLPKKASEPIKKLVESAVANAKQGGVENPEDLTIAEVRVDKATTFTRFMPRARGRAAPIRKHASHVTLTLK